MVVKTFEQSIIAGDLPAKESIDNFIQNDGVVLAIWWLPTIRPNIEASEDASKASVLWDIHIIANNRFIGDIKIHNEEFDETYYGFEVQGRTFLSDDQKPLGRSCLRKWK